MAAFIDDVIPGETNNVRNADENAIGKGVDTSPVDAVAVVVPH